MTVEPNTILPKLQEALLRRGVAIPPWRATPKERDDFIFAVARVIAEERLLPPTTAREAASDLATRIMGLGLLEPFLAQDGVEEIIVRGGAVLLGTSQGVRDTGMRAPDDYFYALAQRVAEMGGKPLRAANPFVLVDLPDGSRFTAMVPPLSKRGTAINIRRFQRRVLSLEQLVQNGTLSGPQAEFLHQTVLKCRHSILISGRPGAGKTTLLNSLVALLPPTTQLCGVETFEEITTNLPFEARAVVREESEVGQVTMAQVVNILYTRMRPDVIIIGEIVGNEAEEYLHAINLGVVAYTTIHGNSVLDALHRLEDLARTSTMPLSAIRERIARGVDLGIHMDWSVQRHNGTENWHRRVTEMVWISGDANAYHLTAVELN